MPAQSDHPLFEIVTTKTGALSIRNKKLNEIMHNPVGPWIEANSLYIEQSDLQKKLSVSTGSEFVLFDVGLGAGTNALAALICAQKLGKSSRAFRIVSFEEDLEMLRFALRHSDRFSHFAGYQEIVQKLLDQGFWRQDQFSWELRHGNFLDLIQVEEQKADLIFYDPYSPQVNQDMWTSSIFQKLRKKCRESDEGGTCLYTYSLATRIRVALITAGFFVGTGLATGLKSETTEATTDHQHLKSALAEKWFMRWQKSDAKYPFDCALKDQAAIDQIVTEYFSAALVRSPAPIHAEDGSRHGAG